VNQPDAEDLLLTGRSVAAADALGDWEWCRPSPRTRLPPRSPGSSSILLGKSAAALACATVAARGVMQHKVRERLAELERLYLDWLMRTRDANEGLAAFLEKRQPAWTHQ
jgi:cyclohexa-1,5-dienecarbonyl-CoA hydratase